MATDNGFGALKDVQVGAQMDSEQEKKELEKLNSQYEIYKEQFEGILSVFVDVRDAGDEIADKDVKKAFDKSVDAVREAMDKFMDLEFVDEITTSMKVVTIQNDLIWKIKELVEEMAELADVDIVQEKISNIEGDKKTQAEQDGELLTFFEDSKKVGNKNRPVSVEVDGKLTTGRAQEIDNVEEKISWHEAKEEAQDHGKDNLMIREELGVIQKEVSKMDKAIDKLKKGTEKNNAIKELKEFKMQAAQKLHKIVQEKIAIEEQRRKDAVDKKEKSQNEKNTVESNKQTIEVSLEKYDDVVERAKKDYSKNKRIKSILDQTGRKVKAERGVINMKNKKKRAVEVKKLQTYVDAAIKQIEEEMQHADTFLSLVKEFGRTKTVYYDTNDAENKLKIISYDGKNGGTVTYENGDGRQVGSAEEFRTIVANMKKEVEQLTLDDAEYSQLVKETKKNYKKNKKLQEFVTAVDNSVKKKKEKLEKEKSPKRRKKLAQALQKYLIDVTAQIQDRISSADKKNTAKNSQKKEPVVKQSDDADVLSLDDEGVSDNADLDGVDENLFSADVSDESVTEELGTENVQANDGGESDVDGVTESGESDGIEGELEDTLDNLFGDADTAEDVEHIGKDSSENEQSEGIVVIEGLEELSDMERSTIEQMFVGKKQLFEQLDKNDTDKVSEFWIDIAREIKEESAANDVRTTELVNIIKRNFGENVVDSVQNETSNIEENEEVDRIGIMEERLGINVLKEIILYTRAVYDEVEEGYDWSEYDDMEKEEIISDSMEVVITNSVKMADAEYAQADFTKKDSMEIFRQIFIK